MIRLVLILYQVSVISSQIPKYTYNTEDSTVQNIIYDDSNKRVFVGGTNQILRLSDVLEVLNRKVTGPELDNLNCYYGYCTENDPKVEMDNVNKILLISQGLLIYCGSVFGGRCNACDLSTLKDSVYETSSAPKSDNSLWVASAKSPTFAITGSGLAQNNEGLFVAVDSGYKPSRLGNSFPYIASYYLNVADPANMFRRVESGWVRLQESKGNFFYIFKSPTTYFHVVGKRLVDANPFISRTCLGDVGGGSSRFSPIQYNSYVDVQFKCDGDDNDDFSELRNIIKGKLAVNLSLNMGGKTGDDVLIAIFYDRAADKSAICPLLVSQLNEKFDEYTGLDNRCDHNANANIPESEAIVLEPIGTFKGHNATTLLLQTVKDDNVLVMGTSAGDIMKIVLRDRDSGGIKTTVRSVSIKSIKKLTASSTMMYGYSGTQVFGEPLGNCETFETCETCAASEDPFCGWCLLKARCMQYSECDSGPGTAFIPELWVNTLAQNSDLCFPMTELNPPNSRITNSTGVAVTSAELVNALRGRDSTVECVWMMGDRVLAPPQNARFALDGNNVICSSPALNPADTSIISSDTDNILTTVKMRVVGETTPFMTIFDNYPLYYCKNNKLCYDCTTSQFDCMWCKNTNKCIQNTEKCGRNVEIAKEDESDEIEIKIEQDQQCPTLSKNEYALEKQSEGEVAIKVSNIPMSTEGDYKCVIQTDTDGVLNVPADPSETSSGDQSITCTVPLAKMNITGEPRFLPLVVTYKGVQIYNPNNAAQLVLYSCNDITDCSTCKGLDERYDCTWCRSINTCERKSNCEPHNQVSGNKCSGPVIERIYPKGGPLKGGTLLTVEGTNLSIRFSDIQNMTVAGEQCDIVESGYRVSTRVTCRTNEVSRPNQGPVIFNSINGRVISNNDAFFYRQASISEVRPMVALKTGGTAVEIFGSQLDMGSKMNVTLAGNPCVIISKGKKIVCRTLPVDSIAKARVAVNIDNAQYLSGKDFEFIDVPDVQRVFPMDTVKDGGIDITLSGGRGFNAITSAKIYYTDNSQVLSDNTTCQPAATDNSMICTTPALTSSVNVTDEGLTVDISLVLEDYYTTVLQNIVFTVYPNPVIDVEEIDTVLMAGTRLVVTGKYFDRVKGIRVLLNDTECLNLDVADTILACDVPDLLAPEDGDVSRRRRRRQASEDDAASNKNLISRSINITVVLGNFRSEPIQATFVKEIPPKGNIIGIAGACAAGGLVVLLLLLAVCLLHKRRVQQKKQFKHLMLHEMEKIEVRLAEECKQVFTELQTDLADLNSDFSQATIPYHSFDDYALKVLFPAQDDYPVLHDPADLASYEDSLVVFEKLVRNEDFLLTLVETLDGQRQVSKRDKSNIAALMIVSLMDDMSYITTILRQLLSKLISDTVNNDARRMKVLLRRSEHITEKYLSNWLTFNLHTFLVESAGQPLYVLYRAIKQQIEKGPVDYITGNARYALHEKNLLSRITDFNKLNVMVYLEDDSYLKDTPYTPHKSCQVSLLSCDTISQAKAKIIDAMYRAVPDSLKPTPNDVDVEWKNGGSSSLRLVDMLHNTQDGWKQLDTLGSLNIGDQAVFQCTPRQSPPPFMSQSGGAPSCNSLLREIENGRVWHLEREVDNDSDGKGLTGVKSVPEVFLTRLSATKIPLQKFVDDLFEVIFSPNEGITALPPCVKYLMDFLDEEAARLQINDPEVVHTWKNNALPLRYWISIIKSPDVVFDVRKNNNIDSCLSVIAQTFIDATYYEDMTIDKSSQSSRLLYCKEIPTYKQRVREFYGEITTCRPVSESEVDAAFNKNKTETTLRRRSALYELFNYACRFSEEVREALQDKGYRDLVNQFSYIADTGLDNSDSAAFDPVKV